MATDSISDANRHWTLRAATPDDIGAIRDVTRAAYAKWVPMLGREPLPMSANYDDAVQNHLIDLLFIEGQLAALIEIIPSDDHLLIENLAVSPGFQARGLGRTLLCHAEHLATTMQRPMLRLYTNKLFAENIVFYQRFGYVIDREEPFRGGFMVHMSKRIIDQN